MLIRDILSLKGGTVYSVDGAATLGAAVSLMVEHDVGSLVVTEQGCMMGLLTFREVLRAVHEHGGSLSQMRASEIMVCNPLCGSPQDTIEELRELMTREHVRYLPVKEGEKLVGIVSFHDVAKAIIKQTRMENRLLRRFIEQSPEIDASI